jgi:hypothetical protein
MTAKRGEVFKPLGLKLAQRLEVLAGTIPDSEAASPPPRPPGARDVIESRLIPCDHCGTPVALLIFAPEATDPGQFEDYARKMYPEYMRLNVPTWIIGLVRGSGPFRTALPTSLESGRLEAPSSGSAQRSSTRSSSGWRPSIVGTHWSFVVIEQRKLPERFRPRDEFPAFCRPPKPTRLQPRAGSDSSRLILGQSRQELGLARSQGPENERGVILAELAAEPHPLLEPLLIGRGVLEHEDDAEGVDRVAGVEWLDPEEVSPGFLPGDT